MKIVVKLRATKKVCDVQCNVLGQCNCGNNAGTGYK
jgi:hypothetical protein